MNLDILQAFQKELTCFICLNYLMDPVTIDCGHSFCQPCLCLSWEQAETPACCPVCRKPSQQRCFETNIRLKNLASIARQASFRQLLSSEEHMCLTHKETKKIFCEEDKKLLCLLCSTSQEHRAHRHPSVEGAAEESRQKLLKKMRLLWKKIQENQRYLNEESRMINEWIWYVHLHREITNRTYQMLHPRLHEEEKEHLERLIKERRMMVQKLKKSKAKMLQKRKHLKKGYKELMKMCHKPDVELLQDSEDLLAMCEMVLQRMPQPMRPQLSAQPITGVIDRLNHFRVDIAFNNEMSGCNIVLFDDETDLVFGRAHGNESSNSHRPGYFAAWSNQGFTSGKHYWELDVNDSWDWAVGVCRDSVVRTNHKLVESEDIFLLLCLKEGTHYSLLTTSPIFYLYTEKPLGRVGVFLDLESKSISFFNVAKSSLIWRYNDGSLNFPVKPVFWTGHT